MCTHMCPFSSSKKYIHSLPPSKTITGGTNKYVGIITNKKWPSKRNIFFQQEILDTKTVADHNKDSFPFAIFLSA